MIKILFVCLGNICRSPLAEAIFKQKVAEKGYEAWFHIDSAGTGAYHIGEDPDPRSIEIALTNKVPISHKGRQFTIEDEKFDYILAMDQNNFSNIQLLLPVKHKGLFLMRAFDTEEKDADVPDPYFGGAEGFEKVYGMLDRSCDELLKYLVKKHQIE